jgi:glutamate-1-semialdehyde 2,1-aminomutase
VTGFRFAYGGAQAYYGVTPDICTLGKAIGGGFPLAAVAGRADIMAHFDKGKVGEDKFMVQIGTLSGNPIAAVAGLKTLEILKRPGAYEQIFKTGSTLMKEDAEILRKAGVQARVVGDAPMFDVVFTAREVTDYRSAMGDEAKMKRCNQLLRERGILKGESKYYISLAHTDAAPNARLAELLNELRGWSKVTLPTYGDRKVFFASHVNGEPGAVELQREGAEASVRDLIAAAVLRAEAGVAA